MMQVRSIRCSGNKRLTTFRRLVFASTLLPVVKGTDHSCVTTPCIRSFNADCKQICLTVLSHPTCEDRYDFF